MIDTLAVPTGDGAYRCGKCHKVFATGTVIVAVRESAKQKCGWCRVWNRVPLPF